MEKQPYNFIEKLHIEVLHCFILTVIFHQIFDEMDHLIRNEAEIGTHVTYRLFESIRKFCKFESSMAAEYGYVIECTNT